MESAKPIEPGCRALIIGSTYGNDGEVTVVCYIGKMPRVASIDGKLLKFGKGIYWEVDRLLNTKDKKKYSPHIPEHKLIRIDDPDLQKQIEAEEELVVVR